VEFYLSVYAEDCQENLILYCIGDKECVPDIKYTSHYTYNYYFSHFYAQGDRRFGGTVNLYLQLNVTDYAVICFC
jgi:hypothetical protein